jgi:2-polyprenyl-3-methyl-5-hydroxy-6-metoxy-1,4-benzoquinol methylase
MQIDEKRSSQTGLDTVQSGNKQWWTSQTMSYDWNEKIAAEKYSAAWFDEIDRRFVFGARLFGHNATPFDAVIPFEKLAGKRVLEIGCGMGLHTELLVRAGAEVTTIDISPTSVDVTRRRLALKGLEAQVVEADAVAAGLPSESFDFVWSWGVIHHSSKTGRIVREIDRMLKPGGEVRVMVYNIEGMSAYVTIARRYLTGFWRGRGLDELLWKDSDGFMARYYSADMLRDVFSIFFEDVKTASYGQDADAVPLPRQLRRPVLRMMSLERQKRLANQRGGLLFVTGRK